MELTVAIISIFLALLLGLSVGMWIVAQLWERSKPTDMITGTNELLNPLKVSEEAGIFHPIPPAIKREQKLTEEARLRGEDSISLDEL